MDEDPHAVSARLGIDESVVRRLQARGYLRTLPLTDDQIRERLYLAHLCPPFVTVVTRSDPERDV